MLIRVRQVPTIMWVGLGIDAALANALLPKTVLTTFQGPFWSGRSIISQSSHTNRQVILSMILAILFVPSSLTYTVATSNSANISWTSEDASNGTLPGLFQEWTTLCTMCPSFILKWFNPLPGSDYDDMYRTVVA